MGIYSANTHIVTESVEEIQSPEPNLSYSGSIGEAQLLIEMANNDHMIFESLIMNDFKEATLNESSTEEEINAIYEATTTGFIEKIRSIIESLWAKLNGMIQNVKKAYESKQMREFKKHLEKTRKDVEAKDFSKMKYSWRKPIGGSIDSKLFTSKVYVYEDDFTDIYYDVIKKDDPTPRLSKDTIDDKVLSNLNYAFGTQSTSINNVKSDYLDTVLEKDALKEGLSSTDLQVAIDILLDGLNKNKTLTDVQNSLDKDMSKTLKDLKQLDAKFNNKDSSKENKAKHDAAIAYLSDIVAIQNRYAVKKISIALYVMSITFKDARALYTKSEKFNPKQIKENAVLIEAYGDVSDYEFDMAFEA